MVVTDGTTPAHSSVDLIETASGGRRAKSTIRCPWGSIGDHAGWTGAPFHASRTRTTPRRLRGVKHASCIGVGVALIAEISGSSQGSVIVVAPTAAGYAVGPGIATVTPPCVHDILLRDELGVMAGIIHTVDLLMLPASGCMGDVGIIAGIPRPRQRAGRTVVVGVNTRGTDGKGRGYGVGRDRPDDAVVVLERVTPKPARVGVDVGIGGAGARRAARGIIVGLVVRTRNALATRLR